MAAQQVAASGREVDAAIGWFDPLLAGHAEALEGWVRPGAALMVFITDPPAPLLPTQARSELVAALRVVDFVVPLGTEAPDPLLKTLSPTRVYRAEEADAQRQQDLIENVRSRESSRT